MAIGDVRWFELFAPVYDLVMPGTDAASLESAFARAERPIERVLDVGGGTGRGIRALDVANPYVLDPAVAMLRRAEEHDIGVIRGDGSTLPVQSASMDGVLVVDALHHVRDQRGLVEEAHRVLRPGGALVIREFDPETVRGRLLVLVERLVGFDSTFHPPEALERLLEETGFQARTTDRGFGYTTMGIRSES